MRSSILDGAAIPEPSPFQQPICGRKTDARERSRFRFSQELPASIIFRRQMAPERHRPTTSMRFFLNTANVLENTHMDTLMPPSVHRPAQPRRLRLRSPNLVHGTLFRRPRAATAADLDDWFERPDVRSAGTGLSREFLPPTPEGDRPMGSTVGTRYAPQPA
jgi:hypothetical protein